jgi:malonyl-CoA O-methyltransferase
MTDNDRFHIDKRWLQRSFSRAAGDYDAAAVLQHEVGQRMLERLQLIRLQPQTVIDIGAGTGRQTRQLASHYPQSQVIALDLAPGMLHHARKQLSWRQRWQGRQRFVCADAEHLPFADNSADLLFSNVTLQWCDDLDRVFAEFNRVLRPGGLLLFSNFGPDTLHELRRSWQTVDPHNHVNAFMDMHDIGDALLRSGLSDPVMDMEMITLTYPDLHTLMTDLKIIGAHNVTAGRPRGLTGRQRLQQLTAAYETFRTQDNLLPASYEVIYGHAWKADARQQASQHQADGSIAIPLSALKTGHHDTGH